LEKTTDESVNNAVGTIKTKPKFKRALAFSINVLQKLALESGTQCRDNCFVLQRDGAIGSFSSLLEHHPDDEEIVKASGKCLQQVLKLLPFDQVVINMINNDIPKRCVEIIEFKDTTEANKELFLDILGRLCFRVEEFSKFYDQGVAKLAVSQLKTIIKVDWETQTEPARKISEGYIKLCAGIASKLILNLRKHN
jgi:hypothetical protein